MPSNPLESHPRCMPAIDVDDNPTLSQEDKFSYEPADLSATEQEQ